MTDTEALLSWVLDLLDHAEVLRPPEIREAMVARLEASGRLGRGRDPVSRPPDTAGRLRRLLAILAWLAQEGDAPIDEVAERFDLAPAALVAELEMAACCGVPPYTPDQLLEIVVTDTTVSTRLGTTLARPRRLSPREGLALAASARALLAVPGSDEGGALSRALAKLDRALGGAALDVELDSPEFLGTVRDALVSGERVELSYYSASADQVTERTVTPQRVFAAEGHWYLDAWCATAGDVRRFRVDRIRSAQPVAGHDGGPGPRRRRRAPGAPAVPTSTPTCRAPRADRSASPSSPR